MSIEDQFVIQYQDQVRELERTIVTQQNNIVALRHSLLKICGSEIHGEHNHSEAYFIAKRALEETE